MCGFIYYSMKILPGLINIMQVVYDRSRNNIISQSVNKQRMY